MLEIYIPSGKGVHIKKVNWPENSAKKTLVQHSSITITILTCFFENMKTLNFFFWSDSRLSLPSNEGRGDEKGPSSAPPSRSNAQCSCKLKHYTHANIVSHLIRPDQGIEIFKSLGWNVQII